MLKRIFLLITLIIAAQYMSAQDIVVIGQVLSATDAQPLVAANVWFKGTDIGCSTNEEGFFMIRSPKPQKAISVSVVGYKKRNIKLDYGKDQMVTIYIEEDVSLLDEVVAMPNQNEAIQILKKVNENRRINDPDNMTNIQTTIKNKSTLNITNIKSKTLQRKLFRELRNGVIEQNDTNFSLPVYAKESAVNVELYPDSQYINVIDEKQNSINILPAKQWEQFLAAYTPNINLYKPYSTILGSNFMSPVAKTAKLYYNLYLADSTDINDRKNYQIRFSPKLNQGLLFKGTLWIDSATYAITKADISVPPYTSVNYLNNLSYKYHAVPITQNNLFPYYEDKAIGLQLGIVPPTKGKQYFGSIFSQTNVFEDTKSLTDTLSFRPIIEEIYVPPSNILESTWNGIDSINQTRIQKFTAWIVDLILNEHLHIWKFDIGSYFDLLHFNQYEGISPRLTLRSGESFAKYFTFGGYYGYGFKDKNHKYGGNIQWRFGPTKRNTLSLFYDHKTYRYGYEDISIYEESRIHDVENIANAWPIYLRKKERPTVGLRGKIDIKYQYEKPGFKFTIDAFTQKMYANRFLPYIHNGSYLKHYNHIGIKADFRLSWKQKSLDYFFHRIYMPSKFPVVHLTAELGYVDIGQKINMFGKFGIYAQQRVPIGFGHLNWALQASAIVGGVPFPELIIAHSSRASYRHDTEFMLIQPMEFISDLYVAANIRYQTRGYIFGYIPYVQKLGIREDIIFNIGYGHLDKSRHNKMLAIPSSYTHEWNKMPYIECGFGLSNILKIADVEFIWRVTHRDSPYGQNFGVRWRIGLDF